TNHTRNRGRSKEYFEFFSDDLAGNEQVEAEEDLQQDNIPQDREVEILKCPKACFHGTYKSPKVGPLIGSLMCRRSEACCYSNNSDGL
ncbi:hypothetical protein EJB05_13837, partial [Eragrostis curvula]